MKENEKPAGLHNKLNDVFAPRWLTGEKIDIEYYSNFIKHNSALVHYY